MEDKRLIFIADDPGGYDVIRPVYDRFIDYNSFQSELILLGASKDKDERCAYDDMEALTEIKRRIGTDNLDLLITGTSWGRTAELEAIKVCKSVGIPVVSILDYWCNYKSRFLLGNQYIMPDFYFVPDNYALCEAVKDGIPEDIIRVVGQPGLDTFVNHVIQPSNENRAIFLSQPLSVLYDLRLGYNELTAFPQVISACQRAGYTVDVKFHPKEGLIFRNKYKNIEVNGDLYEILPHYKVLIGMSTMGLLQYALAGMPIISFEPGMAGFDYCITNELGITKPALNEDELMERLWDIDNFQIKDSSYYIWMDGKSTDRCVKELIRIVSNDKR